jgi:hypothetical protein
METLWQWHDAVGVKKNMPQCSNDGEIVFSKLDSHAFLAKLSNAFKKTCPAGGQFSARYVRAFSKPLF